MTLFAIQCPHGVIADDCFMCKPKPVLTMTYKSDPLSEKELAEVRERRLRPDGHRLMGSDYPRLFATIDALKAERDAAQKEVDELRAALECYTESGDGEEDRGYVARAALAKAIKESQP